MFDDSHLRSADIDFIANLIFILFYDESRKMLMFLSSVVIDWTKNVAGIFQS